MIPWLLSVRASAPIATKSGGWPKLNPSASSRNVRHPAGTPSAPPACTAGTACEPHALAEAAAAAPPQNKSLPTRRRRTMATVARPVRPYGHRGSLAPVRWSAEEFARRFALSRCAFGFILQLAEVERSRAVG